MSHYFQATGVQMDPFDPKPPSSLELSFAAQLGGRFSSPVFLILSTQFRLGADTSIDDAIPNRPTFDEIAAAADFSLPSIWALMAAASMLYHGTSSPLRLLLSLFFIPIPES